MWAPRSASTACSAWSGRRWGPTSARSSRERAVLVIGGLLVLLAAYLARRQAEDEKVDGRYPTFADKEPRPDAPPSLEPSRSSHLEPTCET